MLGTPFSLQRMIRLCAQVVASTYHAAYCDSTLPHIRAYHKHSSTWRPEPIDSTSPTRSQAVPGGLTDTMKVCVFVMSVCVSHVLIISIK